MEKTRKNKRSFKTFTFYGEYKFAVTYTCEKCGYVVEQTFVKAFYEYYLLSYEIGNENESELTIHPEIKESHINTLQQKIDDAEKTIQNMIIKKDYSFIDYVRCTKCNYAQSWIRKFILTLDLTQTIFFSILIFIFCFLVSVVISLIFVEALYLFGAIIGLIIAGAYAYNKLYFQSVLNEKRVNNINEPIIDLARATKEIKVLPFALENDLKK